MSFEASEETVAVVSVESSAECADETMKTRMPKLLTKQAPSVGVKVSQRS